MLARASSLVATIREASGRANRKAFLLEEINSTHKYNPSTTGQRPDDKHHERSMLAITEV